MAIDYSTMSAALKETYTPDLTMDHFFKKHPTLMLLKRDNDMGGDPGKNVPVYHSLPQSRSADFVTAQQRSSTAGGKVKKFQVNTVSNYQILLIDGKFIKQSRDNKKAFITSVKGHIDHGMMNLTRDLSADLFGAGWGSRGVIGSIASDTITLTNKRDIVKFEVGMFIQFSQSESGHALRGSGGKLEVIAVNRAANTIKCSANISTISGTTTNDHIFQEGDREDSGTPTARKLSGFPAWAPEAAPASTAFFGVDRSVDDRLGGSRYDGSAEQLPDALLGGAEAAYTLGGCELTHIIMNPSRGIDLQKIYQGQGRWEMEKGGSKGQIGIKVFKVNIGYGDVSIVLDRDCPINTAFGFDRDRVFLGTMGGAPALLSEDGNDVLRAAAADGVEARIGYYAQFYTDAPAAICNIKLPAA